MWPQVLQLNPLPSRLVAMDYLSVGQHWHDNITAEKGLEDMDWKTNNMISLLVLHEKWSIHSSTSRINKLQLKTQGELQ